MAKRMCERTSSGVRVVHQSLIDPAVPPLQTSDIVDGTLADRYVSILDTSGDQFVSVVRMISDGGNHPMVFQCAAGKDRTGLVAAIVLGLLGVDDETIATDYAASATVNLAADGTRRVTRGASGTR